MVPREFHPHKTHFFSLIIKTLSYYRRYIYSRLLNTNETLINPPLRLTLLFGVAWWGGMHHIATEYWAEIQHVWCVGQRWLQLTCPLALPYYLSFCIIKSQYCRCYWIFGDVVVVCQFNITSVFPFPFDLQCWATLLNALSWVMQSLF
jgi:hypothetical protein